MLIAIGLMLTILTDERILHQKSKRVSSIDDTVRNLIVSLKDTMIANNGVGLAAPQCGVFKRIIVTKDRVLINPEIINHTETTVTDSEGCLSIPNTYTQKERYSQITVKYRNTKGHPKIETFIDLMARIIQHEIDHLDGILMTDNK